MANRQLANEIYETEFGLYDFTQPGSGLSRGAIHPKEDFVSDNVFVNRIREYLELEVKNNLGLSITEYLNCTRHEINTYKEVLGEYVQVKSKIRDKIDSDNKAKQEAEAKKKKPDGSKPNK